MKNFNEIWLNLKVEENSLEEENQYVYFFNVNKFRIRSHQVDHIFFMIIDLNGI